MEVEGSDFTLPGYIIFSEEEKKEELKLQVDTSATADLIEAPAPTTE